jgi:hypothetical protein
MNEANSNDNGIRIDNNPDKTVDVDRIKKSFKNPWAIVSAVLAVALIVLLVINLGGGLTGNTILGEDASNNLVDYLNGRTGGGVEFVSYEDFGSNIYQVTVKYEGQDIPVYISKDGEYFIQGAVPITGEAISDNPAQQQDSEEVPKSDRPLVELFIWSYCPYGVQAQGPLVEVAKLLGGSADFEGVLYYDGHGEYETQQNKIQACIQEVSKDKYWDYAAGFVEDIYPKCGSSRDVECDKTESVNLMKSLGIDDQAVMSCVEERGEELISEHSGRASAYGVTGSPSLVINGVKVNTARNAEAFKTAVCGAFNEAPEQCNEELDSSSATASGNC